MKKYLSVLLLTVFAAASVSLYAAAVTDNTAEFMSLEGKVLERGNIPDEGGCIRKVDQPLLHFMRSSVSNRNGTVVLLPGGGYQILASRHEGTAMAKFFNDRGFDVAILEHTIASGAGTRDKALKDSLAAYRFVKKESGRLGLNGSRFGLMGFSAGGHLSARTVSRLRADEQPDDLILVYPAYLNETSKGTRVPAVKPPVNPKSRLFAIIAANDNTNWVSSCKEYASVWKETGGEVRLEILPDGGHGFGMKDELSGSAKKWPDMLAEFVSSRPQITAVTNPAAVPVLPAGRNNKGWNEDRLRQKREATSSEQFDLIMVGDSITHNFENPEYQAVWQQFFQSRKALNLGFGGARTENLIAVIRDYLNGQSPKVITVMLGTNNADAKNYPTHHTGVQIAGGLEAVIKTLREKCPDSKIILLRCFPGAYGGPGPTSHRAALDQASEIAMKLADDKNVFFCDVNHVFLNLDGSIKQELMPDWLHPNAEGAMMWAQAMEPLMSQLMGDVSRDTNQPANTAVIPAQNLEKDSYNWLARHADVMKIRTQVDPEIVLIGDSITHFWGGEPKANISRGPKSWESVFAEFRVLNLGFGWDRTQNVLWRLDHGELDGLHPRTVIIHIGTNNTSETKNARKNTPAEIVEGIAAICGRVRSKVPGVRILLMQVFPREEKPDAPRRKEISGINSLLAEFGKKNQIEAIDLAPKMLNADGSLSREIMADFCHPTEKGYQIWAEAIRPYLDQ